MVIHSGSPQTGVSTKDQFHKHEPPGPGRPRDQGFPFSRDLQPDLRAPSSPGVSCLCVPKPRLASGETPAGLQGSMVSGEEGLCSSGQPRRTGAGPSFLPVHLQIMGGNTKEVSAEGTSHQPVASSALLWLTGGRQWGPASRAASRDKPGQARRAAGWSQVLLHEVSRGALGLPLPHQAAGPGQWPRGPRMPPAGEQPSPCSEQVRVDYPPS